MSDQAAKVKEIGSMEDFMNYQKSPVLFIFFLAPWCGPCRFISPVFEKYANNYSADSVIFAKCDVEQVSAVGAYCHVVTTPNFVACKNGEIVDQVIGANPQNLEQLIQKYAEKTT